ncbi:MAG: hypothetical protein QOE11_1947 [Solirubrobacteraceae bacterium]|nr:hypothetical protein [Solirubrobacteraceae bacterium]
MQAVTSLPDLVSAAITDQPLVTNATGTPKVKVCFDSPISTADATKFAVSGTDVSGTGNPLAPASAASIPAELSCASLTFPAGTNLAGFSTLEAQAGAVTPAGGGAGSSPQGAAALTGGDVSPGAGKTSGPNLTGAAVASVAGGDEVTYTFDKLISQAGPGAPDVTRFGYYNTSGAPIAAASISTLGDRAVKVKFATTVPATSRVFVLPNAVTLAGQVDQGNVATATSGAGGAPPASSRPDLVKVARVTSLQGTFDLTYDQNITSVPGLAANCEADTPAGRFAGTTLSVQSSTTVRVTFGQLTASAGSDDEVVRVNDNSGCAIDAITPTLTSSVAAAPIQNKDHTPGFTSGPELTGCAAPAGTDVTYVFDERVTTGAVPAGGFALLDASGGRTTGTFMQATDNKVTVHFDAAGVLAAAAACTVDRNAITDRQPVAAEPSSLNTVKVNSTGTPENAAPAPAPLPPVVAPPVKPAPFVPRAARSLGVKTTCHRSKGKVRCTTKGTLKLATELTPLGKKNICIGKVRVRFYAGSKTLSSKTTKLRSSCTYTVTSTFRASSRQRSRLRVQARYLGSVVSKTKNSHKIKASVRR